MGHSPQTVRVPKAPDHVANLKIKHLEWQLKILVQFSLYNLDPSTDCWKACNPQSAFCNSAPQFYSDATHTIHFNTASFDILGPFKKQSQFTQLPPLAFPFSCLLDLLWGLQ